MPSARRAAAERVQASRGHVRGGADGTAAGTRRGRGRGVRRLRPAAAALADAEVRRTPRRDPGGLRRHSYAGTPALSLAKEVPGCCRSPPGRLSPDPPMIGGCVGARGRARGHRPRIHVVTHLVRGRWVLATASWWRHAAGIGGSGLRRGARRGRPRGRL
jgi:hypothetical protein